MKTGGTDSRPSGHGTSFASNNGGAIPSNLLQIPNTESNSPYLRHCATVGVKPSGTATSVRPGATTYSGNYFMLRSPELEAILALSHETELPGTV